MLSQGQVCPSLIWGVVDRGAEGLAADARHRLLGVWAERSNTVSQAGLLFRFFTDLRSLMTVERKILVHWCKASSARCLGREEQCCPTDGSALPFIADQRYLPIVERKVLLQIQGTVCFVSGPRGAMLFHGRVCSSVLHRSKVFVDRGAAGLNCCRFYRSEY